MFNIRYLSSGFERGYKQEERENTQFYFFDFGKCWKAAVLQIIVSLYKVVLRITHSGRSSFTFLLPVVLKQLRLLFNREQSVLHTTCATLLLISVESPVCHSLKWKNLENQSQWQFGDLPYSTFAAWLCLVLSLHWTCQLFQCPLESFHS